MSDVDLSQEELRRGFAALSVRAVPGDSCPPAEAIWDALRGEASTSQTESIVTHTAECHTCAEAWRLGRAFAGPGNATAVRPLPRRRRPWTVLALAASLVIVAGIVLQRVVRNPEPITTRSGEESAIRSLVPESEALHRQACRLRWSEAGPEARYVVRVGGADLSMIDTSPSLDKPEYVVPGKSLEKIPSGAMIVWRVEASLPDGRKMASPAFKNRVE